MEGPSRCAMPRADHITPLLATSVEVSAGTTCQPRGGGELHDPHAGSNDIQGDQENIVVFATPLPPPVLMAVPVATATAPVRTERSERTAGEDSQRRRAGARAGARAVMAANRFAAGAADPSRPRPYFGAATPAPRRICQAQSIWQACLRDGTRMCHRCNKWLCTEHTLEFDSAACCRECHRIQRVEFLQYTCQTVVCALVGLVLFFFFYVGPYRDGRK